VHTGYVEDSVMADELKGFKVAVLATDGVEESELKEPVQALKEAGADVRIVAPQTGPIKAFHHFDPVSKIEVDQELEMVGPEEFDALLLPGGALNADALRVNGKAKELVSNMESSGKPIAFICHAAWLLVSAGLVRGRSLTSYHTIQDDIRNAGGTWRDEQVVRDGNWISSRQPSDIPAFNRAVLELFSRALLQKAARAA